MNGRISVIVTTYERADALDAVLRSIARQTDRAFDVVVADDGSGLPEGFDLEASERLGLQIVRTLAAGELRGSIELRAGAAGGTEAVLCIPLAKR